MQQVSKRTFVLLVVLWFSIAIVIWQFERSRASLIASVAAAQAQTDIDLWGTVHELADEALSTAVADYTFWDDLAEFAEGKRDTKWADENLLPGFDSFGTHALWVLNAEGNLVYSAMKANDGVATPPSLGLSIEQLRRMSTLRDDEYGPMHEFYWLSPIGPLTLFGSDITSTDDPDHLKPARGYYFVASPVTREGVLSHLDEIGATGSVVVLTEVPDDTHPTESTPHVFWHRMYDFNDQTIGAIRVERRTETYVALLKNSASTGRISTALWLLAGILTSFLIIVLGKTQQRAASLAEQMTKRLREANALLEQRVAERTLDLEEDIKRRTVVEENLKKQTEELQRLNRVMIDREMRVVELKKKLKKTGEGESV